MPRFVFKLDPLLRVRERAEQTRQITVAQLERRRIELEDKLRRHQQDIAAGKRELGRRLVGRLEVHELRMQGNAALSLSRHAQRTVVELAGLHTRLDEARVALIAATRERRSIELLRDRAHARWREDQERLEVATTDELAVIGAARKEITS